jgi:flavorubredoxin
VTGPVTGTVEWVSRRYDQQGRHEHVSLSLLRGCDDVVLVDSGSVRHREAITDEVRAATDGTGDGAIVPSHSDDPHAANVPPLGGDADRVELVASPGAPEQQGLPDARNCEIGGRLEREGRTRSFVDPPLADRSHTTWIFDHRDGVRFTADGFGSYHDPGRCEHRSGEFADGTPAEAIHESHRDSPVWLRYVDPERIERALEAVCERFEVDAVAPVHGNPIVGDDVAVSRDRLHAAVTRVAEEYGVD